MKPTKMTVWALGMALGVAVPALPGYAQRNQNDNQKKNNKAEKEQREKIEKRQVPEPAFAAMQAQMGPKAKEITYHRVETADRVYYLARYIGQGGVKGEVLVAADGTLLGPGAAGVAPANVAPTTPATPPAATPAAPAPQMTAAQAAVERERLAVEEQRQRVEAQRIATEVGRYDQRIRDLQAAAAKGDANAAAELERARVEQTRLATQRDRLQVEISRLSQRQADLAQMAGLSTPATPGVGTQSGVGAATGAGNADTSDEEQAFRYTRIGAEQVPPAVVQQLNKLTQGGKDIRYRREVQGDKVSYSAHYIKDNGKRYWASVNENGTMRVEPKLSTFQPDEKAGQPMKLTPVDRKQVPGDVIRTVTRLADKQGGHDWEFFKVGEDDFLIRYTTKDDKHMETRIDNSGGVVSQPSAVKGK